MLQSMGVKECDITEHLNNNNVAGNEKSKTKASAHIFSLSSFKYSLTMLMFLAAPGLHCRESFPVVTCELLVVTSGI